MAFWITFKFQYCVLIHITVRPIVHNNSGVSRRKKRNEIEIHYMIITSGLEISEDQRQPNPACLSPFS